jgi:hypothetical protein
MSDLTHEIALPSGLRVVMREPTLDDLRVLGGRRKEAERKKPGQHLDPMAACFSGLFVELLDKGPYVWDRCQVIRPDGTLNWSQVLQGDTSRLLLELRRLMLTDEGMKSDGDLVSFEVPCRVLTCQRPIRWQFHLSELEHHGLSPEAEERFRTYGPELCEAKGEADPFVELVLPRSKRLVRWKLLTREDQYRAGVASNSNPDQLEEYSILARLPFISGATDPKSRRTFATNLPMGDADHLRRLAQKHDIWTQDTLELRCTDPSCRQHQKLPIPLGEDFFSWDSAEPLTSRWPSSDSWSSTSPTTSSEEEA